MKQANVKRLEKLSSQIDEAKAAIQGSDIYKKVQELKTLLEADENPLKKIRSLHEEIESIRDEEQEIYDNRTEKWKEGEKGEAAYSLITELDNLVSNVNDLAEKCDYIDGNELENELDSVVKDLDQTQVDLETFFNDYVTTD